MTTATAEPQADATEVVRPSEPVAPRYAEGTEDLSAAILAARPSRDAQTCGAT